MYNNIRMRLKHTGRIFCGIQYSPCDGSNIYKSIVANIGPCMWQVESRTRAYTAMKILTYKPRRRPMCLLTNGRINYIQTKWVGDTYILEIIYCFKIEVHLKLVFQLDIFFIEWEQLLCLKYSESFEFQGTLYGTASIDKGIILLPFLQ